MTNSANPLVAHREELQAALKASTDGVGYTYVAPIREQIGVVENNDAVLLPGELCLAVAEAYGATSNAAMPAAIALSLLSTMTQVYDDIAAEDAGPLERSWGLPRTLNALDAFYALAQSRFMDAVTALPERFRREAVKLLDEACHHLSIDLHEGAGRKETLLSAAATLGGMFADADPQQVVALTVFGMVPSTETLSALTEPAQGSLRATLPYITKR